MWQKCSAWTLAFSGSPEFLYADMLFIPFASGSEQGKGSLTFIPLTTLAGLSSPFLCQLYTQQRTENTEK